MTSERRKTKRSTVVNLDLFDQQTEQRVGQVVNISDGGIFTIADERYEIGEERSFFIPFSETIQGQIKFHFKARTIWAHPNSLHPSKYSVGLEFTEDPDLQTIFIKEMSRIFGKQVS